MHIFTNYIPSNIMENSIVQLFGLLTKNNPLYPWQLLLSEPYECTGFCIEYNGKKYILTNNHCVSSNITVYVFNNSKTYNAFYAYKSVYCDMALLKSEACEYLKPLAFEQVIPQIGESLHLYSAHNYIINKTKGIFRTLEIITHPVDKKLTLFIVGQILGGDSGGPVINKNNKVVGIIFYGRTDDNTGYAISYPFINHFFRRFDYYKKYNKEYNNITRLQVYTQSLETKPTLREYFELPVSKSGVLIRKSKIKKNYIIGSSLMENDILLKINNNEISNSGNINAAKIYNTTNTYLEIPYEVYFSTMLPGDKCTFTVFRNKDVIDVDIVVKDYYYPIVLYSNKTPYYKWSGLTFLELSVDLIIMLLEMGALSKELLTLYKHIIETTEFNSNVKLIILTSIIYSPLLDIQNNMLFSLIKSVNSTVITNIDHLKELLDSNMNQSFIRLDFYTNSNIMIFNSENVKKLNRSVYF